MLPASSCGREAQHVEGVVVHERFRAVWGYTGVPPLGCRSTIGNVGLSWIAYDRVLVRALLQVP